MTGYVRSYDKTDGVDPIRSGDFESEFTAIETAFNQSSGHRHDGTVSEGPYVAILADTTAKDKVVIDSTNHEIEFWNNVGGSAVQQVIIKDGVIEPTTNNDIDLGSSTKYFKNIYGNILSVADVKTYGATCNGVVDDTTYIANAYAANDVILIPGNTVISSLTLNRANTTVIALGDITITGAGFIITAARVKLQVEGNIIGTSGVGIVGGALSPAPTVACAVDVRSSYFTFYAHEISGFVVGIIGKSANVCAEGRFTCEIRYCNTGVKLETANAWHEGNIWTCQVFGCEVGYDIGVDGTATNAYQHILGVVDCASITAGIDIRCYSGNQLILPYYVRWSSCVFGADVSYIASLISRGDGTRLYVGSTNGHMMTTASGAMELVNTAGSVVVDMTARATTDDYTKRMILSTASKTASAVTSSGTTVTVTLAGHGYEATEYITVSGADQAEYNGSFEVATVVDVNTFTYTAGSVPSVSPATGTILIKNYELNFWTMRSGGGASVLAISSNRDVVVRRGLRIEEVTSAPALSETDTDAKLYVKGNKLIVMYNHGGTMKYRYLDLTSTDATWTYTTTAP